MIIKKWGGGGGGGGAYNDREYTYTWVEAGWDDIVQL